jgi:N-acetyl-gamma-glutamyl-phosphate reductase
VERFEPAALDGIGLVFAALPHGESQKLAPLILERGIPFVDLGADFRLDTPTIMSAGITSRTGRRSC